MAILPIIFLVVTALVLVLLRVELVIPRAIVRVLIVFIVVVLFIVISRLAVVLVRVVVLLIIVVLLRPVRIPSPSTPLLVPRILKVLMLQCVDHHSTRAHAGRILLVVRVPKAPPFIFEVPTFVLPSPPSPILLPVALLVVLDGTFALDLLHSGRLLEVVIRRHLLFVVSTSVDNTASLVAVLGKEGPLVSTPVIVVEIRLLVFLPIVLVSILVSHLIISFIPLHHLFLVSIVEGHFLGFLILRVFEARQISRGRLLRDFLAVFLEGKVHLRRFILHIDEVFGLFGLNDLDLLFLDVLLRGDLLLRL
mmetsp:Transcript_22629/g.21795  ORF Transcript_22629/g.21795 Transcript_22629/m.21795 type:complete len:307 (+) Transcript_22629:866-1786(+)